MDELLGRYEGELDIEQQEEEKQKDVFNNERGAIIAMEVNLLKQVSIRQLKMGAKKEAYLSRAETIDQFMDQDKCDQTM